MVSNNRKGMSLKIDCFWSLALTVFFAINMNYDWSKSSVAWYGSIFLVVFMYIFVYNGYFQTTLTNFSIWFLSFIGLCVLSLAWSLSVSTGFDVIKSMIVMFVLLLFIQFSINYGYSINTLLKCYFIATLVNMVYVFTSIDVDKLGDVQLGAFMLDGWNGNGIGFIMTQGVFIGVYLLGQYKDVFSKLIFLAGAIALSYLTICTGSRTAFIMLVVGLVLYFWFNHPTKMVRNVIVTAIILYGAFYLAMQIESFYNVLGSRLEGLFALFSGEGTVDGSANIRNVFIQNGQKWFVEEPLFGYGINNYKVLNRGATGRFTYAHNTFIELAVDLGIMGLIWYYGVYIYLGKRFISAIKESKLNTYLFAALIASAISQYGSVTYYGFYQNFILMLCFYAVSGTKKERNGVTK